MFHFSKHKYPLLIISLVILVSGVFLLLQKKGAPSPAVSHELPTEYVVHLTDEGFEPHDIAIQEGSAVRFVNESSTDSASVNSDDFPTNKKYPGLNLGVFQKGSTLVHIFNQKGEFGYHNQFKPEHGGTIRVE